MENEFDSKLETIEEPIKELAPKPTRKKRSSVKEEVETEAKTSEKEEVVVSSSPEPELAVEPEPIVEPEPVEDPEPKVAPRLKNGPLVRPMKRKANRSPGRGQRKAL